MITDFLHNQQNQQSTPELLVSFTVFLLHLKKKKVWVGGRAKVWAPTAGVKELEMLVKDKQINKKKLKLINAFILFPYIAIYLHILAKNVSILYKFVYFRFEFLIRK